MFPFLLQTDYNKAGKPSADVNRVESFPRISRFPGLGKLLPLPFKRKNGRLAKERDLKFRRNILLKNL